MRELTFCRIVLFSTVMFYMLLPGAKTAMTAEILMKIYFIPFTIETYTPVTQNNIEEKSLHAIWFTQPNPFIGRLHSLLQSSPTQEKVDDRVIRLKVEFVKEREVFYVDQDGIGTKDSKKYYKLSKKVQDEVEKAILYFSGVIDIKANKELE